MKVDNVIADAWREWMLHEHIPAVLQTKCFTKNEFAKLLDADESDGMTYIVQYFAESKADYNRYVEIYAPLLRKENIEKWGDKVIAFRTLMEIVQ